MNQIFGQRFISYLKKWGVGVNYCWNCGPSKLILHFIVYRQDQLNSKDTKVPVNSTIQYFEGCSWKKFLLKVWRIFGPLTTKWRPCKIFTKLTRNHLLMDNIFKIHEYQTFGWMKMHNMCKILFANNIFSLLWWNKKYFSWFLRTFSCQKLSQTWDCAFNYISYLKMTFV